MPVLSPGVLVACALPSTSWPCAARADQLRKRRRTSCSSRDQARRLLLLLLVMRAAFVGEVATSRGPELRLPTIGEEGNEEEATCGDDELWDGGGGRDRWMAPTGRGRRDGGLRMPCRGRDRGELRVDHGMCGGGDVREAPCAEPSGLLPSDDDDGRRLLDR